MTTKKTKKRFASLAVAAVLVFMCMGYGVRSWMVTNAVASVVSLDVNPSIQLEVNRKEKVLAATPLNEDARVILADMDLEGTQLKVAVNAIVGSLLQNGYLDSVSSAILISVEDKNADRASQLETTLTSEVNQALETMASQAAILTQVVDSDPELEAQAQANHISVGKANLIRQIQATNPKLSFDDLSALSAEELNQLRKTGAPNLPIGKEKALNAALKAAGLTRSDLWSWEVDAELDEYPPHYEVDLVAANGKLEYYVDGYTGKILRSNVSGQPGIPSKPVDPNKPSVPNGGTAAQTIGEQKAIAIALGDAGVRQGDTRNLTCKLDRDDGVTLYEVEFDANGYEYSYDIRAKDGTILESDREMMEIDDDWDD